MGVLFGGNILRALNQLGLVRQEKTYLAELKPSSIFSLNDANPVLWFTCLALILAGLGIALAFHANYKRESTLYASAGFIVATLGVGLLYPWAMVTTQALGVIALISIRRSSPRENQLLSESNKQ